MKILKADGTLEEFKERKLITSLRRAGAQSHEIDRIVRDIERSLSEGMRTQLIYQKAFEMLREGSDHVAAKYSLRRAVFSLGPTGFPFEDYLGKIFEAEGYKTKRRLVLRGKCATHEIDLAAYSPNDSFIAEAKFHSHPGVKSDLQVAMYSYARFLDLNAARICADDTCGIISLYVITNTKFTTAATKYAACAGIKLLSWDQPKGDSLHTRIERHGLYPVTALTRLSARQKQDLMTQGVILCSELVGKPQVLHAVGLRGTKIDAVLHEASMLCGPK
jgi:hypothetical protein